MLEEFRVPILEVEGPDDMLFQQDGLPPNFHNEVMDVLSCKFPKKLIGRGVPTTWPPRSPDLIPLDFFFWGYIKDAFLRATTGYHFAGTCWEDERRSGYSYLDLLNNVWTETEYRHNICRATQLPHWTSVNCRSQKPDHITNSTAFSFNSCAFYFMSNVTVKWYTFHVHTLYIRYDSGCTRKCLLSSSHTQVGFNLSINTVKNFFTDTA
jgi:hypothetical protein